MNSEKLKPKNFSFTFNLLLLVCLIFIAAACNRTTSGTYTDGTATIAGKILDIEVAKTAQDQALGLSGRESIGEGQGMLFVFDKSGKPGFWMKDMNFPIDIIWIKDNKVVDISADAQIEPQIKYDSDRKIYTPAVEIDKVLEVKTGWSLRHNLKIGDSVEFKFRD